MHALRTLLKSPGFMFVAILTLALGVGLSTSSFSLANAFLLRNVPYPEADQLVRVFATSRQAPRGGHAPGNIIHLRENARSLGNFAIFNGDAFAFGEPGQPPEQVGGLGVTSDFFDVLRVYPSLGRRFTPEEMEREQPDAVILTHRAWMRRFGGDPSVIGRTLRVNLHPHTIVGIMPEEFDAPLVWGMADVIVPRMLHASFRENRRDAWMQAVGRLREGVSMRQAQAELSTLMAALVQEHPTENAGRGIEVVTLHDSGMDNVSRALLWLMTAIALTMLLIACANLASLQVARAFGRSREFAIRAALGGSRRQLMSPLLAESFILAALGGAAGLLVAFWSNHIVGNLLLIGNEPGFPIPLDGRVMAFALFASALSGLAFGLTPAWISARAPAGDALKEGSRGSTGSRSHQRLKRSLIVIELALALALVGVAASFGFGAKTFLQRKVGWSMDQLFTGYLALPYNPYNAPETNRDFQRKLLPRLASIPGVEQAVLASSLPMYALSRPAPLRVDGQPEEDVSRLPLVEHASVGPGYFAALQIPIRQGTPFDDRVTEDGPQVAVINETFAKRFWPGQDPIGRRFRIGEEDKWSEVIAVVGDVGMMSRFDAPETRLQVYRPLVQHTTRYLTIVLRSTQAPDSLSKAVREAVAAVDADIAVASPGNLRSTFERNLSNLNIVILNLAISAGMGLLIAAVGLFGVIAQLTAQRTRDIGVRIALGAQAGDVITMVLRDGLRLMIGGILIGVPLYLALAHVLRLAMPEMTLPGLWLLAVNIGVLAVTMLVACYLPARRATRIDPVIALRAE
jgi:putative ABC transport system permease protein